MKTRLILIVLALSAGVSGCAMFGGGGGRNGTQSLAASAKQPAAEGTVSFGEAKNGNTKVDLSVKHLASPDKLTPSESTYVVWTQRDTQAPPQNIGALQVDKDLTGTLNTVTPLRRFDLFITAEPTAQTGKPTGEKQLWTSFSK